MIGRSGVVTLLTGMHACVVSGEQGHQMQTRLLDTTDAIAEFISDACFRSTVQKTQAYILCSARYTATVYVPVASNEYRLPPIGTTGQNSREPSNREPAIEPLHGAFHDTAPNQQQVRYKHLLV